MAKKSIEDLEVGDLIADRYLIDGVLGDGGFGKVFRARHRVTEERCAVKVLQPEMMQTAEAHTRFQNEVRAAARTDSPHSIRLFDVGIDEFTGAPWIAMELLQGETLEGRVKRAGPLPWTEARGIFVQLGDAFGAAHDRGVLHLDIKPENLFLAQSQVRGREGPLLKVIDFGISRLIAEGRTHVTVVKTVFSPRWFAPEQSSEGVELRATADVWALGLVAFWALCGKEYWVSLTKPNVSIYAVLVEVVSLPLEAASARAMTLGGDPTAFPPGFDGWFARAVHRTPSERFADAREAMTALVALIDRVSVEKTRGLDGVPLPPVLDPPAPARNDPSSEAHAKTAESTTTPWPAADPSVAAWRTKGECSLQLGMHADAVNEFSAAIARSPWDAASYRGRASAWRAMGQGALAEADEAVVIVLVTAR